MSIPETHPFAFDPHYGTARHRAGIERHGPCRLHRMSFQPLRRDEADAVQADLPGA